MTDPEPTEWERLVGKVRTRFSTVHLDEPEDSLYVLQYGEGGIACAPPGSRLVLEIPVEPAHPVPEWQRRFVGQPGEPLQSDLPRPNGALIARKGERVRLVFEVLP